MITWADWHRFAAQYMCFLLILMRVTGMFFLAPVIGGETVLNQVKVWMAVFVSLVFLPVINPSHGIAPNMSFMMFTILSIKELTVGVALGFLLNMPFVATRVGSEIVGRLSGMGIAQVINPDVDENVSILSEFVYILVVLFFLYCNGHQLIIKVLAKSFDYVPLGKSVFSKKMLDAAVRLYKTVFDAGITYGAPILGLLLVIEAVFGIVGKTVPEMNIMIFALPIRLTLGLIGTMIAFPFLFAIIRNLMQLTEKISYAVVVMLGGGAL